MGKESRGKVRRCYQYYDYYLQHHRHHHHYYNPSNPCLCLYCSLARFVLLCSPALTDNVVPFLREMENLAAHPIRTHTIESVVEEGATANFRPHAPA